MNVNQRPRISVIIALYNNSETLNQCLDSIFDQTNKDVELIVIDGGSTDGSIEILQSWNDKISYWMSESDNGIFDAWNKGVAQSSGDWVCFLGADDYFYGPSVLMELADHAERVSDRVDFIYSRIRLIKEDGKVLKELAPSWPKAFESLKHGMSVPHPAMLHRSRVFSSTEQFDPTFRVAGDYEFFLRKAKPDNVVFARNVLSVDMRMTGASGLLTNQLNSLREARQAQIRHGFKHATPRWYAHYLFVKLQLATANVVGNEAAAKLFNLFRA